MIGSVGATGAVSTSSRMPDVGKAGRAVGQLAKTAVETARQSGVDLPKNAQGMAARAIAKGAEPASVFAALTTPPPDAIDETTTGDPAGFLPPVAALEDSDASDVPSETVPGMDDIAGPILYSGFDGDADAIALALLNDAAKTGQQP